MTGSVSFFYRPNQKMSPSCIMGSVGPGSFLKLDQRGPGLYCSGYDLCFHSPVRSGHPDGFCRTGFSRDKTATHEVGSFENSDAKTQGRPFGSVERRNEKKRASDPVAPGCHNASVVLRQPSSGVLCTCPPPQQKHDRNNL